MKSLFTITSILISAICGAQYSSPNQSLNLTMQFLAENSGGAVVFNNDTYEIYEDITISETDTLSVADELVMIDENVLITVAGGFYASGSSFSQLNCCEAFYEGFRFEETAVVDIFNTLILRGGGIKVLTPNFKMEDSNVSYHTTGQTTGSALDFSTGKPEILSSTFIENQVAAIGSAANAAVAPVILNCTFEGNVTENSNRPQVNLGPTGADTAYVSQNVFTGNPELTLVGGFSLALLVGGEGHLVFSENILEDNRYGLNLFGANITSKIEDNSFVNNNTQNEPFLGGSGISISGFGENEHLILRNLFTGNLWGITLISDAMANLGEIDNPDVGPGANLFSENGNEGVVYALFNNTPNTIMAQGNCWDFEDQDLTLEESEAVISHVIDDPELGEVIFDPIGSCIFLSTEELLEQHVTIYPNPASDLVFIHSDLAVEQIEILDLEGRRVYAGRNAVEELTEIDLTNLAAGLYIIRLKTTDGNVIKKLNISH